MPDIGGGLKDFVDYMRADRPHRWTALGLAMAITFVVGWAIWRTLLPVPEPRSITYVQSWPADRSDFDVRRDWLRRGMAENEQNRQRRLAYGAVAETIGQTFDRAGAMREFDDARRVMQQAMDDLDAAQRAGRPLPPLPRSDVTADAPRPRDEASPPAAPATPPSK